MFYTHPLKKEKIDDSLVANKNEFFINLENLANSIRNKRYLDMKFYERISERGEGVTEKSSICKILGDALKIFFFFF